MTAVPKPGTLLLAPADAGDRAVDVARIRARKGTQVAAVAVARKITTIAWQSPRSRGR